MSNPNPINLNSLDARYAKPADVVRSLAAQASQIVVTNTVTETLLTDQYIITANSVVAGDTYRIRAWGTIDNDANATVVIRCNPFIGGNAVTSSSAKTLQNWMIDYTTTFRAAASSATPMETGGFSSIQTNGNVFTPTGGSSSNQNMTVDRPYRLTAQWSVASATNIIRCEGCTIEKVH